MWECHLCWVAGNTVWSHTACEFLYRWGNLANCYICVTLITLLHLKHTHTRAHTPAHLVALFSVLPRWAGTGKVKPIWILLKQETVSGSSISWAVCKSAPCFRQITMPATHHSVFYGLNALPAAQPTAWKHWRFKHWNICIKWPKPQLQNYAYFWDMPTENNGMWRTILVVTVRRWM